MPRFTRPGGKCRDPFAFAPRSAERAGRNRLPSRLMATLAEARRATAAPGAGRGEAPLLRPVASNACAAAPRSGRGRAPARRNGHVAWRPANPGFSANHERGTLTGARSFEHPVERAALLVLPRNTVAARSPGIPATTIDPRTASVQARGGIAPRGRTRATTRATTEAIRPLKRDPLAAVTHTKGLQAL
jgi:hypothetical protein